MSGTLDWLTTRQAAEELGITRRRVQALIDQERLPAQRVGRDWLVNRQDLELVRERPVIRKRLTRDQVAEIRGLRAEGESVENLAKRFGVSQMTIYRHLE